MLSGGWFTRFLPMRPGSNHPSRKKVSLIGGQYTGQVGFPAGIQAPSPEHLQTNY
ncbi:hypothetical protein DPMN_070176 [Dreissena polymorpha]|uniref:Uncharacterized protein n=1 Tax=Dreissena polymorpha TaxID=45954 RepID=A0A9D3Z5P7_DREPO|nr:hypothetical protein DPMN_070176 [Dreissena polymorpha]